MLRDVRLTRCLTTRHLTLLCFLLPVIWESTACCAERPNILFVLPASQLVAAHVPSSEVRFVEVKDQTINVGMPDLSHDVLLANAGCFESEVAAATSLYRGTLSGQVITLNRFGETGRDRLFDRFVLTDLAGRPLGQGRYADRLDKLSATGQAIDWPSQIKGLQSILDMNDAVELGVAHMTLNISITSLIAEKANHIQAADEFQYEVDGNAYNFNPAAIRRIDNTVRGATDLGINVVAIILCTARASSNADNPLIHPDADLANSPTGVVAANTVTAEGERRYRAVMGFLGNRYSRKDKRHGHIGGYIIGNEVQSHWSWHNMGQQLPEAVIRQYADQVRLSYYSLKQHSPRPRVFISMDHHWSRFMGMNPSKAISGRQFLNAFAKDIKERGDFPWHVAWHPYPEDLFNPAFWNDKDAWHSQDTPKITFKNIEVLAACLQQNNLLHAGQPRSLILSEQGFHAGNSTKTETLQAAAYAASFVRIKAIKQIEAYILHRHVDHPREGGLKLGLRKHAGGKPAEKRLSYHVFAAAETDQQDATFKFALPITGLENWTQMLPQTGPFPKQMESPAPNGPSPE